MHIHIVACRVLTRELSALVYDAENNIDITWMPQGLHETPSILHAELEAALDNIYEQLEKKQLKRRPDVIVLGYGLCSNSLVGLTARDIPLVVPRADDCITLFLGSKERYLDYFTRYSGTYWLNNMWVENSPEIDPDHLEKYRAELMEEYDDDEDTVEYLLEIATEYTKNYKRVGYIDSCVYNCEETRERAMAYAAKNDLEFFDVKGDNVLLKRIVAGEFDDADFLTVPPGYTIKYSDGPERMVAVPEGEA